MKPRTGSTAKTGARRCEFWGDAEIVPAYTYTASASVVAHVGATIVLVDSQKDNVEMDYDKLANAITERTKVIVPVDIAGICDYSGINVPLVAVCNVPPVAQCNVPPQKWLQ